MRTYTITKTVYNFSELSENAKRKALQDYLNTGDSFRTMIEDEEYDIKLDFPRSTLNILCDISCCQGSGCNITGDIDFRDFIPLYSCTDKEKRALDFYCYAFDLHSYQLETDYHYTYSCKNTDLKFLLGSYDNDNPYCYPHNIRGYKKDLFCDFIRFVMETLEKREKMIYNSIMEFHDTDNKDTIEYFNDFCDSNELEFDEYGNIV